MLYSLMDSAGHAAVGRNKQARHQQTTPPQRQVYERIGGHKRFASMDSSTPVGKPPHNKEEQVVNPPDQAERDNKPEKPSKE